MLLCGDVLVPARRALHPRSGRHRKCRKCSVITFVNIDSREMIKYDDCMFSEAKQAIHFPPFPMSNILVEVKHWCFNFCWIMLLMLTKWLTKHITVPFIESYIQFSISVIALVLKNLCSNCLQSLWFLCCIYVSATHHSSFQWSVC